MDYLPRKIEKDLEKWIFRREVILLKGPRQSGKTTILKYFCQKFGGQYLSLEIEDYAQAIKRDPIKFARRYLKKKILYLDEVQYVKDIGRLNKDYS
ncbi:AAA family ATPase [Thermodesulfatator indicus]